MPENIWTGDGAARGFINTTMQAYFSAASALSYGLNFAGRHPQVFSVKLLIHFIH